MNSSYKNFGLALLIISLSTPVMSRAEVAGDPQQDNGQHDHGGQKPGTPGPQPQQPEHRADNHGPEQNHPAPPVHRGPPPGEYHEHHHDDTGRTVVATAVVAGAVITGILGMIERRNQTKVVSNNWLLGNDNNFHCYGLNKYGQAANGNAIDDSVCEDVSAKPVRYAYEQYTDGNTYCYAISTLDNSYLNDNYPVENANCEASAQPAPQEDDAQNQ